MNKQEITREFAKTKVASKNFNSPRNKKPSKIPVASKVKSL
jgi:hypothetical protein